MHALSNHSSLSNLHLPSNTTSSATQTSEIENSPSEEIAYYESHAYPNPFLSLPSPLDKERRRLEEFSERLKKTKFWELNKIEDATIKKLKDELNTYLTLAFEDTNLQQESILPYVEAMITLKIIYQEKNKRHNNPINKFFGKVFGNPYVSSLCSIGAFVSVLISGAAYASSTLFVQKQELIAIIVVGLFFAGAGGVGAVASKALHFYYKNIKITEDDIRIQTIFHNFLDAYLQPDYGKCRQILDNLSILDAQHIPETALKKLISKREQFFDSNSTFSFLNQEQKAFSHFAEEREEPRGKSSSEEIANLFHSFDAVSTEAPRIP